MQKIVVKNKGVNWIKDNERQCYFCDSRGLIIRSLSKNCTPEAVNCVCNFCRAGYYLIRGLLKNKVERYRPGYMWLSEKSIMCPGCKKPGHLLDTHKINSCYCHEEHQDCYVGDLVCRHCTCYWTVSEKVAVKISIEY